MGSRITPCKDHPVQTRDPGLACKASPTSLTALPSPSPLSPSQTALAPAGDIRTAPPAAGLGRPTPPIAWLRPKPAQSPPPPSSPEQHRPTLTLSPLFSVPCNMAGRTTHTAPALSSLDGNPRQGRNSLVLPVSPGCGRFSLNTDRTDEVNVRRPPPPTFKAPAGLVRCEVHPSAR